MEDKLKTEVVMKREMLGLEIRQKHKTGFFSVSDIERVSNKHRVENGLSIQKATDYFRSPKSKEFISELIETVGDIQTGGKGRGNEKWVHPYLFIDIALWYSPSLKVKVYQWIYDNLTVFRDNSGESFKVMSKALIENCDLKGNASIYIPKVARAIYKAVGVSGNDKWEKATESQLHLRDKIQQAITTASYFSKDIDKIIDIGIKSAMEEK